MAVLDEIKFKWWSNVDATISLIDRWKPRGCETEKDFERSLCAHLKRNLPNIKIVSQYAVGRARADLVIGEAVIVEIKTDLQSTSECNRLIGQLNGYADWDGRVIVLLTGKTDNDLLELVRKAASRINGWGDDKITVYTR